MKGSIMLLAILAISAQAADTRGTAESHKNPIRRVVDMLQAMQLKVTEEGKKEKELFEKFSCWCKTGSSDLSASISAAEAKISQLTTSIQEGEALSTQLGEELAQHKADRAEAKQAVAQATALREKEAATFAKDSSDFKTNIAALSKATTAIEKGASGSFLQTAAAARLRELTLDVEMSSVDRDVISAFLAQGQGQATGYVPQSGQITGILKQMEDTMDKDLADITSTEETAIKDYEALVAAKEKEIAANSAAIESKLSRKGQLEVDLVNMKEDLDDTGKALLADKKFLAEMDKSCATKQAEWEERSKTRTEELLALADTIKLLNDDDSLELFKKTLPSASALFLQTAASGRDVAQRALKALGAAKGAHRSPKDSRLELITLALKGGSRSFDKVLAMIDDMVALLGKEQKADDSKKAYCLAELDKSEDEKKVLEQTEADLSKAIEDAEGLVATLTEDIEALEDGIKKLDKQVAEATDTRKAEHANYVDTMSADNAAKDLIGVAKNRLAKFYSPKLYKPPPKRELTSEERITVSMGGSLAPTAPPGGIAGTGITYLQDQPPVFAQVSAHVATAEAAAPPPPPDTWGAYQTKGEGHTGVLEMLNMLVADLDKEVQSMTVDETDAQSEYESLMADSGAKRAADTASIAEKEGAKADLEAQIEKDSAEKKATMMAVVAKAEYIKDLHIECDWLLANFEVRKSARAGEVASLKDAKAVLSGADYSLAQTSAARTTQLLRGGLRQK
jgi:hypothetical protein